MLYFVSQILCYSVLIYPTIKQLQNTKPCAWRIMNVSLATSTRRVNKAEKSPGEKRKKDTTSWANREWNNRQKYCKLNIIIIYSTYNKDQSYSLGLFTATNQNDQKINRRREFEETRRLDLNGSQNAQDTNICYTSYRKYFTTIPRRGRCGGYIPRSEVSRYRSSAMNRPWGE